MTAIRLSASVTCRGIFFFPSQFNQRKDLISMADVPDLLGAPVTLSPRP